jgi:hypothetical protein
LGKIPMFNEIDTQFLDDAELAEVGGGVNGNVL